MGLSSIISRISSVKGDILIDTAIGQGTKITIKIGVK